MKTLFLRPLYDKAIKGLPVLGTPQDQARKALASGLPPADAAKRLDTAYLSASATTGFVGGLPGFLLLPVTMPANVAGIAMIQLHLAAAVASLAGHDVHDDETRDECIRCLLKKPALPTGNTEEQEVAQRFGQKLLERGVRFVASRAFRWGGRAMRSRFARVIGSRRVPLIGGFIGAGTDAYTTSTVAKVARQTFFPRSEVVEV